MRKMVYLMITGSFLTLAIAFLVCYNRGEKLRVENTSLGIRNASLEALVQVQAARADLVERVTVELESADAKRQEKFYKFSKQLEVVVQTDPVVRDVFDTLVPRYALDGLLSFATGTDCSDELKPGAGPLTYSSTDSHE